MSSPTKAIIYLADQRGTFQMEYFRSYHTFNFGTYFNENRKPFGNLVAFNDDTLKGGSTLKLQVEQGMAILLLPVVGALQYKNNTGIMGSLDVGQCHIFTGSKNSEYEISNPYKDELINCLHCMIAVDPQQSNHNIAKSEFDVDANKNQLVSLLSDEQERTYQKISIHIGKFDGRKEGVYRLKDPGKGVFIFVIEGAFEVQNRLLQGRDGLALWNSAEIEFESLSNEAIILLLET